MSDSFKIVGQCLQMCPQSEYSMRKREGLLHKFELEPEFKPVKEFTRSAAGIAKETSKDIRPPEVLERTLHYLINNIVTRGNSLDVYNFVSNRLRAIKQDLFKQQCTSEVALPILEPITRYYAWASYWYSEDSGFEEHLHDLQLLDCLKECLRVSDEGGLQTSDDIEALYIVYTLARSEGVARTLDNILTRRSPLIEASLEISLHCLNGIFSYICKQIKTLPVLVAALLAVKHLEAIRRHGLVVLSQAYSCKTMVTSYDCLIQYHLFDDISEAKDACQYYGIETLHDGVIFKKTSFNHKVDLRSFKRPVWLQDKLSDIYLPELFYQ